MERISSKTVYQGPIAGVRMDTVRYDDGEEKEAQVVTHPGSVVVIPHDERFVYLVRQPRPAVGSPSLLELPAGKLDVEGETPLQCAKRELGEEIGMEASEWLELKRFYASPGVLEEEITLFLATGLSGSDAEPLEGERIELVEWPLGDLGGAIDACADAASLIGLLELQRMREASP